MKMKRAVVNLTVRVTVDVPTHIYERDKAELDSDNESDVWSDWASEAIIRGFKMKVGPNDETDWAEVVAELDGCEIVDEPEDVGTDEQKAGDR